MEIRVRTLMALSQHLGGETLQVEEGATVGAAVRELVLHGGEYLRRQIIDFRTGMPYNYVLIMVNGQGIRTRDGLATVLEEGDTLTVFPPVAGG